MVPRAYSASERPMIPPRISTGESPAGPGSKTSKLPGQAPMSYAHYFSKETPAAENPGLKKQEASWVLLLHLE